MVERRVIRALVAYSKTTYFLDGARPRGLTYAALMHFEGAVNEALGSGPLRVHVMVIPVPRDELLPALVEGRGDLAASNLTITPERRRSVAFSDPLMRGVSEVVVTGPGGPELESLADLAAQEVHVRASSSYYESLQHLNARLREQGREPIRIQAADELLEDEDILEMVNAGLLPATIVDDHKARFWAQVLDDITVHAGLSVREEGDIGWAFRKDSPRLAQVVNDFVRQNRQGTLVFQQYADRYGFDPLLLVAQAYQESGLDQSAKSSAGALGIMQIKPSTAADPNVGISDVSRLEDNVHAGTKYLRFIADRYFVDQPMDRLNEQLFAFAAYNAGPARIARLRAEASARGLDPNQWFRNVERIAAEHIGRETVQYVSNIYKYYLGYRRLVDLEEQREQARQG